MANQQHIEWLKEGVEAWNNRRKAAPFKPDLAGISFAPSVADMEAAVISLSSIPMAELRHLPSPPDGWVGAGLHGINLAGASLYRTQFNCADLTDANLSNANLEHANLNQAFLCRSNMQGARLSGAYLGQANIIDADLTRAELTNSHLGGASLSGADLAGATLTGADLSATWTTGTNLVRTNLADVRHLPTELWKARIFPEYESPEQMDIEATRVKTVGDLLQVVRDIKDFHKGGDETLLYFRGEPQCNWKLRPSVMRQDSLLTSEGRMLLELTSRRPEDFAGASSALAQWMLAQHHELPTRFLDITSNPLVALYHACGVDDPKEPKDGRLHIFVAPRSLIKPFNSDTVSIIANVAKLSRDDQYELVPEPSFRHPEAMRRLYQQIRIEKPYFDERVDPRDFYRVFIIEPQQSTERIQAQSGAFLASVFHVRFERDEILRWNADTPIYAHYQLTVPSGHKGDVLSELRSLNITREKLFPGLDASAKAIKEEILASAKPWKSNDGSTDIRFATGAAS